MQSHQLHIYTPPGLAVESTENTLGEEVEAGVEKGRKKKEIKKGRKY